MYIDRDVQHQDRAIKRRREDPVSSYNYQDPDSFSKFPTGMLTDDGGDPLALIVNPHPYKGAHYATFPEKLVEPMIKAGTSEKGCCPKCGSPWERMVEKEKRSEITEAMKVAGCDSKGQYHGTEQKDYKEHKAQMPSETKKRILESMSMETKTLGWQSTCSCDVNGNDLKPDDLEIILSPTGEGSDDDPSLIIGRSGFNRPRGDNEGIRPITRYEQRQYAAQLRNSPQKEEMAGQAGEAFAHYLRTDKNGARPIPQKLLEEWIGKGWLQKVSVPKLEPFPSVPCVVMDPFAGSGTVGVVAERLNRKWIGLDLGYHDLQRERLVGVQKEMPLIG